MTTERALKLLKKLLGYVCDEMLSYIPKGVIDDKELCKGFAGRFGITEKEYDEIMGV